MAKRKARPTRKASKKRQPARRTVRKAATRRSVKRPKATAARKRRPAPKKSAKKPAKKAAPARRAAPKAAVVKVPRLERARRTLQETVPTPPSSLNMVRRGTAARTGRAGIAEHQRDHGGMNDLTVGDVDVDAEDAYFTGEEAPGGDNPTPDQDIVDDIGKALGVQYDDNEELKGADKVEERDRHRWELDPASSDDYKDRK
jgi:Family of unknown function (DUF6335)